MELKLKSFSTTRNYGVEMEVSNNLSLESLANAVKSSGTKKGVRADNGWASSDTGLGTWHIKTDSTCGPKGKTTRRELYGYEVASYVTSGMRGLTEIGNVATALKSRGAEINQYCGFHVHADARDMEIKDVGTIMAHWLKVESVLFQACPSSRRNNRYCKSLLHKKFKDKPLDKKYTPKEIWDIGRPKNMNVHDNPEKKYSLNSVGFAAGVEGYYAGKQTLENRMLEGTLDKIDIKNWTRLHVHFISTAKNRPMPSDIKPANVYQTLQYLGLAGMGTEFYILSDGLLQTKIWFLNRLAKFSNRPSIRKEARKILAYIT